MTDPVTIENLSIDEVNYVVGELSDNIQQAVRKYEEWRDRFSVAQDEVQLVGAALRDLGTQIVTAIRVEEEQRAAAEEQRAAAEEEEAETKAETEAAAEVLALEGAPVGETVEEFVANAELPEPVDTLVVEDEG